MAALLAQKTVKKRTARRLLNIPSHCPVIPVIPIYDWASVRIQKLSFVAYCVVTCKRYTYMTIVALFYIARLCAKLLLPMHQSLRLLLALSILTVMPQRKVSK